MLSTRLGHFLAFVVGVAAFHFILPWDVPGTGLTIPVSSSLVCVGFGVTLTLLKTAGGPLTNPALHYGVSAATFVGCPHLQRLAGGKWSSHGKKEMAYLRQEEEDLNVVYIRTLLEFGENNYERGIGRVRSAVRAPQEGCPHREGGGEGGREGGGRRGDGGRVVAELGRGGGEEE